MKRASIWQLYLNTIQQWYSRTGWIYEENEKLKKENRAHVDTIKKLHELNTQLMIENCQLKKGMRE